MESTYRAVKSRISDAARDSLGRVSWGLMDQAASSLTNFAAGIVVARGLGVADFGLFTIVWVTYLVALNLSRGVATDPLMVRYSAVSVADWRRGVAKSSGTAAAIGLLLGLLILVTGMVVGGVLGSGLVALGVVLAGLLLQDSWRFAFVARGDGRSAFVNDMVWGALLVPGLVIAGLHGTVFAFVLAWGLAGNLAAVVGMLQARLLPQPQLARAWCIENRTLSTRYAVENVSASGAGQIRMCGLGAIAGFADVGAVRGAELLMGPFYLIMMGLSLVSVSEASRQLQVSRSRMLRFCALLGGVQAAAAVAWGLVILALPDSVGAFVLGDVWAPASHLLLPAAVSVIAAGLCTGGATGLRALGASRRSLRAQLFHSAAYVIASLTGALLSGARGSFWGLAIAVSLSAVVFWIQLLRGIRDAPSDPPTLQLPVIDMGENEDDMTGAEEAGLLGGGDETTNSPLPKAMTSLDHTTRR